MDSLQQNGPHSNNNDPLGPRIGNKRRENIRKLMEKISIVYRITTSAPNSVKQSDKIMNLLEYYYY